MNYSDDLHAAVDELDEPDREVISDAAFRVSVEHRSRRGIGIKRTRSRHALLACHAPVARKTVAPRIRTLRAKFSGGTCPAYPMASEPNDELLADLLNRCLVEMRDGRAPDMTSICREHPEFDR